MTEKGWQVGRSSVPAQVRLRIATRRGRFPVGVLLAALLPFPGATAGEQPADTGLTRSVSFDDLSAPCVFRDTWPLTTFYSSRGVTFSGPSAIDGGAILNACSQYAVTHFSPPNFLAFHNSSTARMASSGFPIPPETLTFSSPVGVVSFTAGTGPQWSGTLIATAYSPAGQPVARQEAPLGTMLIPITLQAPLIGSVLLETTATAFVIDDLSFTLVADSDADGTFDPEDCAPSDPERHPGALELCDGVDQDCDGTRDEGFPNGDGDDQADCADQDDDNDGALDLEDCAPLDASYYPGAPEYCDGVDQDCDGDLVDGSSDVDQDGSPDCIDADDDGDGSPDLEDCAPADPQRAPGAAELCDGIDQDCDGVADDGLPDADGDRTPDCRDVDDDGDGSPDAEDCAPLEPEVHPGQFEACDGVDNDCDGVVDPETVCPVGDDDDTAPGDDDTAPGDDDTAPGDDDDTAPGDDDDTAPGGDDDIPPEDDISSGCDCRVSGPRPPPSPAAQVILPLLAWLFSKRKRPDR